MINWRGWPLANHHPEGPAPCKWSSKGTGLLQTNIPRVQPLANDHPKGSFWPDSQYSSGLPDSSNSQSFNNNNNCNSSSEGSGLLQMIIRRDRPLENDHPNRLEICQTFYTTGFLGQKIYTPKNAWIATFLPTIKQHKCQHWWSLSLFIVEIELNLKVSIVLEKNVCKLTNKWVKLKNLHSWTKFTRPPVATVATNFKSASEGTGLLQKIIRRNHSLAKDHSKGQASCSKWWTEGAGHLQMIIRMGRPLANDHPEGPPLSQSLLSST